MPERDVRLAAEPFELVDLDADPFEPEVLEDDALESEALEAEVFVDFASFVDFSSLAESDFSSFDALVFFAAAAVSESFFESFSEVLSEAA